MKYVIKTTSVETSGNDLKQLLVHAYVFTGNYENPVLPLDHFDDWQQERIKQEIIEEMRAQDEARNER